jgi:hypothetical protein
VIPPPAATRRLFFGYEELLGRTPTPDETAFLIERLLEEGNGQDLRWLFGAFGEASVAGWFERHGRCLSRRSRQYWSHVLRRPCGEPATEARELWPLA